MSRSLSIILGVVPEEISAWNPDTDPQAMVMKRNGNSEPLHTGPVPSTKRVSAGICSCGIATSTATASSAIVPILRKVER
jgi:hypothetical protein